MRGFKNPARIEFQAVNVATINEAFPNGGNVTVDSLVKAGLARKGHLIKVLGQGDISVKVSVEAHAFSKSAEEKIAAAGGSVKTV
jgi:large subunit ribosomal protein L15